MTPRLIVILHGSPVRSTSEALASLERSIPPAEADFSVAEVLCPPSAHRFCQQLLAGVQNLEKTLPIVLQGTRLITFRLDFHGKVPEKCVEGLTLVTSRLRAGETGAGHDGERCEQR